MTSPALFVITDELRFRLMASTNNMDMHRELQALPPGAAPDGFKLLRDTTYDERSFTEDENPEAGSFHTKCDHCGRTFFGNKKRITCKVCTPPEGVKP